MKSVSAVIILVIFGYCSFAQNNWMLNANMDIIKTDINSVFDKGQMSIEANYFVKQKLSFGLGYEYRTEEDDYFALNSRYHILSFVLIRARVLLNDEKIDFSIAPGYQYFLSRRWRIEVFPEFYFNEPEFALRFGVAYVFTN